MQVSVPRFPLGPSPTVSVGVFCAASPPTFRGRNRRAKPAARRAAAVSCGDPGLCALTLTAGCRRRERQCGGPSRREEGTGRKAARAARTLVPLTRPRVAPPEPRTPGCCGRGSAPPALPAAAAAESETRATAELRRWGGGRGGGGRGEPATCLGAPAGGCAFCPEPRRAPSCHGQPAELPIRNRARASSPGARSGEGLQSLCWRRCEAVGFAWPGEPCHLQALGLVMSVSAAAFCRVEIS